MFHSRQSLFLRPVAHLSSSGSGVGSFIRWKNWHLVVGMYNSWTVHWKVSFSLPNFSSILKKISILFVFDFRLLLQNDSLPAMLARMTGIFGPFPTEMLDNAKFSKLYFTKDTQRIYHVDPEDEELYFLAPKKSTLKDRLDNVDDPLFIDFLSKVCFFFACFLFPLFMKFNLVY